MDIGGAFTDRLIAEAQIAQGVRALDFGCGTGAVTFRLAGIVGRDGIVVGLDRDRAAIDTARRQAAADAVENVTFVDGDLADLAQTDARFDVIMCRRVLMYLPDQVGSLTALRSLLSPGGLLLLQEHDATIFHATADLPLYTEARRWIWDTVKAEGARTTTGFELHETLSAAGFAAITITAEAIVQTPTHAPPTAQIVQAMLPRIEAAGVATAQDIGVDTLEQRLEAERRSTGATIVGELIFGAIAKA